MHAEAHPPCPVRLCLVNLSLCLLLAQGGVRAQSPVPAPARGQSRAPTRTELAGSRAAARARAQQLYTAAAEAYLHDEYDRVLALATEGLRIDQRINSNEGQAYGLNLLGNVYYKRGAYERARGYYLKGLKAAEAAHYLFGIAHNLSSVGSAYYRQGDYRQAQVYYERSLQARRALGDKDEIARALNDLANVAQLTGDYVQALALRTEALRLSQQTGNKVGIADVENDIGWVYDELGDYDKALDYLQRSVTLSRDISLNWSVADGVEHVGLIYLKQGRYTDARAQFHEALALFEQLGNRDEQARTLEHLGQAYFHLRQQAEAEAAFRQALMIREQILGAGHPGVAACLNDLAALYQSAGDYARAEPLYRRALALYEQALGPDHPDVAATLFNLAALAAAQGARAEAVALLQRGSEIREHNLALILTLGSEHQKLLYLNLFAGEADFVISFHAGSTGNDPQAARLALTTILRRKGRALDAMADQIASLRRRLNPQDRGLLDQLSAARAQLAALVLKGAGDTDVAAYRAQAAQLAAEIEQLEAQVGTRSAEFRARQAQPATIAQVQSVIPADAALVELISYRPYNPQAPPAERFGAAHYAAYVLRPEGEPRSVELGAAATLDQQVAELRAALMTPQRTDVKQIARAFDETVMRPVRRLLGDAHTLLLSPDGALNLVPFGALVDEDGRYLIERYTITYLTSGRDLLRLANAAPRAPQPPVVMANPAFALSSTAARPEVRSVDRAVGRRSVDFATRQFSPLQGTAEEAKALKHILPGAEVLTDAQATEAALKHLSAPSILHVATHGFFLPDQPHAATADARSLNLTAAPPTPGGENPLLRSGLVLAGVNRQQSGAGEDGVLTALEAAGLDLWGTRLVVLSACETGIGEVKNGEGVYGLRRALVLAGAESELMSLWQVSDAATRDLMVAYYKRLQAGQGRAEALRQVQLEMLKSGAQSRASASRGVGDELKSLVKVENRSHPFYWASFIPIGDWRSLNGQVPTAK